MSNRLGFTGEALLTMFVILCMIILASVFVACSKNDTVVEVEEDTIGTCHEDKCSIDIKYKDRYDSFNNR